MAWVEVLVSMLVEGRVAGLVWSILAVDLAVES